MRALRKLSLATAIAVAAPALSAQPAQLQFSSNPPVPTVTIAGFLVGPFSATLLSDPTLPTIAVFSLSYLNMVNLGQTWQANASNFGQGFGATKYGTSAVDNYKKAAWLSSQFANNVSPVSWAEIQAAIWNVFTPGVTLAGFTGQNWLNQVNTFSASNAWSSYSWNQYSVLTPTYGGEYLTAAPQFVPVSPTIAPTVTPEPATWILLATGLVGVVGFALVRGVRV
ncbi:MAG: PEP-CTERM sorting domain-containing protein [Gemmatimonadota bacterium]